MESKYHYHLQLLSQQFTILKSFALSIAYFGLQCNITTARLKPNGFNKNCFKSKKTYLNSHERKTSDGSSLD